MAINIVMLKDTRSDGVVTFRWSGCAATLPPLHSHYWCAVIKRDTTDLFWNSTFLFWRYWSGDISRHTNYTWNVLLVHIFNYFRVAQLGYQYFLTNCGRERVFIIVSELFPTIMIWTASWVRLFELTICKQIYEIWVFILGDFFLRSYWFTFKKSRKNPSRTVDFSMKMHLWVYLYWQFCDYKEQKSEFLVNVEKSSRIRKVNLQQTQTIGLPSAASTTELMQFALTQLSRVIPNGLI